MFFRQEKKFIFYYTTVFAAYEGIYIAKTTCILLTLYSQNKQ